MAHVILSADGKFWDAWVCVWRSEYPNATVYESCQDAREVALYDQRCTLKWDRIVSDYGTAREKVEFSR